MGEHEEDRSLLMHYAGQLLLGTVIDDVLEK